LNFVELFCRGDQNISLVDHGR